MEEDRIATDIGPTIAAELNGDVDAVEKKPKRRFIGRKAADAKAAAARAEQNGGAANLEESGAIQGAVTRISNPSHMSGKTCGDSGMLTCHTCSRPETSPGSRAEQHPR